MPRGRRPPPRDPFDPLDGPVDHSLDLHGLTRDEALAHLEQRLAALQRTSPGSLVHVITGRGRGSPGAPVLRPAVGRRLRSLPQVAASGSDAADGGYLVRLAGTRT